MGKDKKPGILGFQTKDALKSENIKLSSELKTRRVQYKDFRSLLDTLNQQYVESKANVPMARYNQLKDMIKTIIDKKVIQRARDAAECQGIEPAGTHSGGGNKTHSVVDKTEGVPDVSENKTSARGIGGLLQRCREFAGEADGLENKNKTEKDLSTLSKQEVTEDNERKRKELEELNGKFSRILNRLEELQRGYEESKKLPFTTRYGKMKELVKLVIKDTSL